MPESLVISERNIKCYLKKKATMSSLLKKIAKGRAELESGKGIPLEQATLLVQSTIEETAQELDD